MNEEHFQVSRTQPRAAAEVTDTIKMQVGANTTDILYLKTKVGDLNTVTNRMDLMTKDIHEIRIDLDEANRSLDDKVIAIDKKIDGTKTSLTSDIEDVLKGIVHFRYWLFGTIVTCTLCTLGVWTTQKNRFQDNITEQVSNIEMKFEKTRSRTEAKLDSFGVNIDDNFKELIRMMKK